MFLTLVCFENNLASVPRNTWWLDSGVTSNFSVSMQGCLSYQKSIGVERYLCGRWQVSGSGSYRAF